MTKKLLSIVLALVMALGMFAVAVNAEDESTTAPAEEISTYLLSELIASLDDEALVVEPGAIIELDEDCLSTSLIVSYMLDADSDVKAASAAGYKAFVDIDKTSGYEVKAIGERTSYADSLSNSNKMIDFANEEGYEFVGWEVASVYSESNYNKVTFVAKWDVPELSGWDGFISMLKDYIKVFVEWWNQFSMDILEKLTAYFG